MVSTAQNLFRLAQPTIPARLGMIQFGVTSVKVGILPNPSISERIENRLMTAVLEKKLLGKPIPLLIHLTTHLVGVHFK